MAGLEIKSVTKVFGAVRTADSLSLVFYTTPWPAMAAGFVGLAVHSWRRGKMHPVRRYVAFTAVALSSISLWSLADKFWGARSMVSFSGSET